MQVPEVKCKRPCGGSAVWLLQIPSVEGPLGTGSGSGQRRSSDQC